jgi:hypothetical protein
MTTDISNAGGGLLINAHVQAGVPSGYVTAVSDAITYFEAKFNNDVTMNIDFKFAPLGGNGVAESQTFLSAYNYSGAVGALKATDAGIAADAGLRVPGSDPFPVSTFTPANELLLTHAEAAAIGLNSPDDNRNNTTLDATVTLNSNLEYFNPPGAIRGAFDAVSTLEHEISEVMGRQCGSSGRELVGTTDALFRFHSGHLDTSTGIGDYFSINGGVTNLHGALGEPNGGDLADWNIQTDDCVGFAIPGVVQKFTAADVRVMEANGWHQGGAATPTDLLASSPIGPSLVAVTSTLQG